MILYKNAISLQICNDFFSMNDFAVHTEHITNVLLLVILCSLTFLSFISIDMEQFKFRCLLSRLQNIFCTINTLYPTF